MNLPSYIAKRYLFSKKSHNVINIISAISIIGVAVSAFALIVVLSAFNGIQSLVEDLYSSFDNDLKITIAEGKTYSVSEEQWESIINIQDIEFASKVIEEDVLVKNEKFWITAKLKGVEPAFMEMTGIPDNLVEGGAELQSGDLDFAVIGAGIRNALGSPMVGFTNLAIYGVQRTEKINRKNTNAFKDEIALLNGVFNISPEFNSKYIITSLDFARNLLSYSNEITGIEIDLKEGADEEAVKAEIQTLLGDDYIVKTRYQQNELIYKTNQTEKLFTFLILAFILVVATFNIIGSLTMLIIDKKKDIEILINLGGTKSLIRKIFFLEGVLINALGAFVGMGAGLLLCWVQINYGIIPMTGTIVETYPILVKGSDVALILLTIILTGTISSYIPVNYLVRKHFDK